MHRLTLNFPALLILVAAWLALAYSGSLMSALSEYGVHGFTQVKLMVFIAFFYTVALAISRCVNAFKPFAILLFVLAAPALFYMSEYGIIIDADMIINAIETDTAEARDQLSWSFFETFITLGVIPSLLLTYIKLPPSSAATKIKQGIVAATCFSVLAVGIAYTSYDDFASLFRNHRDVKYRVAPFNVISATVSALKRKLETPTQFIRLGQDAFQVSTSEKPRVMVIVLGETARADHFSINNYARLTTPSLNALMTSEPIFSYKSATSCGTATAISVPCMFSFLTADNYSDVARNSSNVLDVLETAGINATWIENNSGCKDVCNRIKTVKMSESRCEESQCYDIDMLEPLQSWLSNLHQDSIIVLHQMGSHGPAYYERSPNEMKRFLPECKSQELSSCSVDEITNAYDNSLLVTDELVSQVIKLLKSHTELDSSMMYVSDHGESLGDNGIYLHGLPNWIAPEEQRHIPWIVWPSDEFNVSKHETGATISHDNFSHTILGYFNVEASVYDEHLDLTKPDGRYAHAFATPRR